MTGRNIGIAKRVLSGETLDDMAAETGLHRTRIRQIVLSFCRAYMMSHERLGPDGKMKNLKELRRAWRAWTDVPD
jgi:hypothetical protein